MARPAPGCGKEEKQGIIRLDMHAFGWHKVWDGTHDLIQLDDNAPQFIEAHRFLQQIDRRYWPLLFNECHRVLKKNGVLEIITPDAGVDLQLALADPTHVSFVVKGTFTQYLTGRRPRNADFGFNPWDVVVCRNYDEKDPRDVFVQLK